MESMPMDTSTITRAATKSPSDFIALHVKPKSGVSSLGSCVTPESKYETIRSFR